MNPIVTDYLNKLNLPSKNSHKGQNGRLLIIGGSHLFHAASLWSLKVASRIVDLVHYSSVSENNQIVQKLKEEFRDGIVVPRSNIEEYIPEDDCILIGPGMVREENELRIKNYESRVNKLEDILKIEEEGVQTYYLTKYFLQKYPNKRWVIDAGALQMMELEWIPKGAILTPHHGEFNGLESRINPPAGGQEFRIKIEKLSLDKKVKYFAEEYNCVVLHKGEIDYVSDGTKSIVAKGGNAGMTKGGTGDVLAGLVAALYCTNDAFTSAVSASFINKQAGEDLYKKSGYWFNASDLSDQIPVTMKKLLIDK